MLLTATYEVFMGACNKKRWVLRYRGDISLNSSPERGTPIGKRKQEILTGCPENFLIFLLLEVSKVLNWPAAVANTFPSDIIKYKLHVVKIKWWNFAGFGLHRQAKKYIEDGSYQGPWQKQGM